MKKKLVRLDKLIVDRQMLLSRTLAQNYIEEGRVQVEGITIKKTASMVPFDSNISVDAPEKEWVSRGAHKLIRALDHFDIDPSGLTCIDVGASTGGFTDVLLSREAKKVFAVDVGYGQLAWKLRNDPRVVVMERTNARHLTLEMFEGEKVEMIVSDASFISLKLLLKPLESLLGKESTMIVLVKPQFEVGRDKVGRGVVHDPLLHEETLRDLASFIDTETDLDLFNATYSPIKGPEGNIEFLFLLGTKSNTILKHVNIDFMKLVEEAHEATQ
ncbi:MAG: TlyA family RNA methyltransferase [Synergistaceae bacterium]|jgi:23S rRNA (cytidine1920-2'-O)/16S rRNA (cytidine1409-2'-O)-methyltransferase|nr:TlyA family RNA methyltransferase [Synergistaceae bacterium]MCK9435636.1 TlyA family RNA methyltransferase [Synergistaceae bacterium]MDD2349886.1 TlyA family RNA methyltransferase [Synergistaceae bacterium]MDD3318362.1 TlyA family RNA methyltransferase [Synergistaceae bacterium]MDD3672007.1 TlyA family RNA methyltransferase [Synergistaceae bacterium]